MWFQIKMDMPSELLLYIYRNIYIGKKSTLFDQTESRNPLWTFFLSKMSHRTLIPDFPDIYSLLGLFLYPHCHLVAPYFRCTVPAHLFFHAHPKVLHQFQFLTAAPLLAGYFQLPDCFLTLQFTCNNFHQMNSFQLQSLTEMFICNQTSVHCLKSGSFGIFSQEFYFCGKS